MFVDLESDNADIHVMDLVMLADVIRVCKRYEEEKEAGRRRTPDEKSAMIVRKALLKGALEMPLTALAKFGDYSFRPDACAITGRKGHVSAPLLLLNSALETAFKESCKTATTLITPLDGPTILEAAYYWSFQKPLHISPLDRQFPAMTFTTIGSSLTDVAVFNSWFLKTSPVAAEFSQPTTPRSNAASSNVAATGSSSTITPDALTHGAGNDSDVSPSIEMRPPHQPLAHEDLSSHLTSRCQDDGDFLGDVTRQAYISQYCSKDCSALQLGQHWRDQPLTRGPEKIRCELCDERSGILCIDPKAGPNDKMEHRCPDCTAGLMEDSTWAGGCARMRECTESMNAKQGSSENSDVSPSIEMRPPQQSLAHEDLIADIGEPLSALEALLVRHHTTRATWHSVLNNHSSTKPRSMGGPMFRSLTELKDYGYVNGLWHCWINMPCSFQQGDGILCSVEACAETKPTASENACLRALAHILATNQDLVRLIPKHWNITLTELRERIAAVLRDEHPPHLHLGQTTETQASHQPLADEDLPPLSF